MKNNNTVSKIISLTLVFLLITAGGFFAFANEAALQNTQDYTLSARIGENSDAEQVEVIVSLDDNAGLNGLSFGLQYDADVFTLKEVRDNALIGSALTFSQNLTDVPYNCSWGVSGTTSSTATGDVITFVFTASGMEDMKGYLFEIIETEGGYVEVGENGPVEGVAEFVVNNVSYSIGEHSLTHYPAVDATATTDGNIEYWYCSHCQKYFDTETAENEIDQEDTVIPADPSLGGDDAEPGESCSLSMTITDGPKDGQVDVIVNLDENGGAQTLLFELDYDEERLQLINVDAYENWFGDPQSWSEDYSVVPYRMGWITPNPEGTKETGALAKLTFEVLSEGNGSAAAFEFVETFAARTEIVDGKPVSTNLTVNAAGGFVVPQLPQGVNITGQVKSFNPNNPVTITLYDSTDTAYATPLYTAEIAAGTGSGQVTQNFIIETVKAGTYDMVVGKTGHLDYIIKSIPVGSENLDLTTNSNASISLMTMLAGDINADNSINASDVNVVRRSTNYYKATTAATDKQTDLNGDGSINASDVNIIRQSVHYYKGVSHSTFTYSN